jgi:hypothetical protein
VGAGAGSSPPRMSDVTITIIAARTIRPTTEAAAMNPRLRNGLVGSTVLIRHSFERKVV